MSCKTASIVPNEVTEVTRLQKKQGYRTNEVAEAVSTWDKKGDILKRGEFFVVLQKSK